MVSKSDDISKFMDVKTFDALEQDEEKEAAVNNILKEFKSEADLESLVKWNNKNAKDVQPSQSQGSQVYKLQTQKGDSYKAVKFWQDAKACLSYSDLLAIWKLKNTYYHANIILYEEIYTFKGDPNLGEKLQIAVVMEFQDNNLEKVMNERSKKKENQFKDAELINMLRQAFSVAEYLEDFQTNLFNIKPSNILIDKDTQSFLFSDFGQCKSFDGSRTQAVKFSGSASIYTAPEYAIAQQMPSQTASINFQKCDIYSIGVTLLKALSNQGDAFPKDIKTVSLKKEHVEKLLKGKDKYWQELIQLMTAETKDTRPDLKGCWDFIKKHSNVAIAKSVRQ